MVNYIEKTDYPGSNFCQRLCDAHGSHAEYLLHIGWSIVPMCQTCIDELYEEILPQVSAEVRDKSK